MNDRSYNPKHVAVLEFFCRVHLQFAIDVANVRSNRFDADEERRGNLLVAATRHKDVKDLLLAIRQQSNRHLRLDNVVERLDYLSRDLATHW